MAKIINNETQVQPKENMCEGSSTIKRIEYGISRNGNFFVIQTNGSLERITESNNQNISIDRKTAKELIKGLKNFINQ
jgi:hypothetical protein